MDDDVEMKRVSLFQVLAQMLHDSAAQGFSEMCRRFGDEAADKRCHDLLHDVAEVLANHSTNTEESSQADWAYCCIVLSHILASLYDVQRPVAILSDLVH